MSEYIDLDTPLEAFRLRGNQREPISTTLRELLDFNKAPYTVADVVPGSDFRDCRNELCLRCGRYETKHLGSCKGCRWEKNGNGG